MSRWTFLAGALFAACNLLTACGGVIDNDVVDVDAGSAPDVDAEVPVVCDPTAPFGVPVELTSVNTTYNEWAAIATPDLLTFVVSGDRPAYQDNNAYLQTRESTEADFGTPTKIAAFGSATTEEFVSGMTADGMTLYGQSGAGSESSYDVLVASRPALTGEFGAPTPVANINSAGADQAPFLAASGALYFASDRDGDHNLFVAQPGAGGQFAAPVAIGSLNSPSDEHRPVVTGDELAIYFMRDEDVFVAHRSTLSDGFGVPARVEELSTDGLDRVQWVSTDGCAVLIVSDGREGTGGMDVFVAVRGT